MQGSPREDVVFAAARVYTVTVPGPNWKSWFDSGEEGRDRIAERPPFSRGVRLTHAGPHGSPPEAGSTRQEKQSRRSPKAPKER